MNQPVDVMAPSCHQQSKQRAHMAPKIKAMTQWWRKRPVRRPSFPPTKARLARKKDIVTSLDLTVGFWRPAMASCFLHFAAAKTAMTALRMTRLAVFIALVLSTVNGFSFQSAIP